MCCCCFIVVSTIHLLISFAGISLVQCSCSQNASQRKEGSQGNTADNGDRPGDRFQFQKQHLQMLFTGLNAVVIDCSSNKFSQSFIKLTNMLTILFVMSIPSMQDHEKRGFVHLILRSGILQSNAFYNKMHAPATSESNGQNFVSHDHVDSFSGLGYLISTLIPFIAFIVLAHG